MKDTFNNTNIKPFFQTIIFKINKKINKKIYLKKLKEKLSKYNESKYKFIKKISEQTVSECDYYIYSLKEIPTWYKKSEIEVKDCKDIEPFCNKELILCLIYQKKERIYIHTTNSMLEGKIVETLIEIGHEKINLHDIYAVLDNDKIQVKTLGIHNLFGGGGIAPEAKTYYGRETQSTLSKSFDSGYAFSYCLASEVDENKKSQSFGCSTKKRKVWGTWTSSISEFVEQCNTIDKKINSSSDTVAISNILVKPLKGYELDNNEAYLFFMDYTIPKKGFISFSFDKTEPIFNWFIELNGNKIYFNHKTEEGIFGTITEIQFEWKSDESIFEFKYSEKGQETVIKISSSEDEIERKKDIDIVEYLNTTSNYTIMFGKGIAYRDKTFWKDNRLTQIFNDVSVDISWDGVDIKKESKPSKDTTKINISQRVEKYLKVKYPGSIIINDDGANEVADFVCFVKEGDNKKVILVHNKASSEEYAGLRVGDIQVVVAQAIKNMRFFIATSYTKPIIKRLTEKLNEELDKSMKETIHEYLKDTNVQNECWIVQPGTLNKKLENSTDNKIHSLLNYVDGVCNTSNVKFKFFGSSEECSYTSPTVTQPYQATKTKWQKTKMS